ncbi:AfsR/SARP family transcriptional regulator [Thermomonospora amylolytica]|uniref:AfsR/SARP family transcriptional regulator n=1 Tax=Thermomonospora amylolytica TaxID=1411117 RepID=UPI000E6C4516|nr:AfsR/SARP family transcriptional regulator [Thermomonospora amylolytica]
MRYRILGPLELWEGDRQVPLAPTKWRVLLAVLLVEANQMVSTDRLLEELWGERPPQSAAKLLQGYVSRVRQALDDRAGRLLVTHVQGYKAHGYRLVVAPDDVDAHRFEDLVEQGRRALGRNRPEEAGERLREALALWRDTPFADVPSTPAVEAETTRLAVSRLHAQELRIEVELRLGHHESVLDELEALAAANPLRESLRGQLMLALYRAGRQADALAVYQSLRDALVSELGIEPGPPLQELHLQILKGDATLLEVPRPPETPRERVAELSPPAAIVPRQLPRTKAAVIGRGGEISVIRKLLERDDGEGAAIVAIDGIGGVGKSALAIHSAHQVAARFPDGQLYVDLRGSTAGLAPLGAAEVLGRFLTALGVDARGIPGDVDDAAAMFRSLVADRRVLVVLDNAANADQVRPLLPAGPGCAVLITSREILTTLEGAAHVHLDVLFHDQAIALLEKLVGPERVAAERETADAIVQRCGGLPLALRIVGARLAARPGWPLSTIRDKLADAQTRLDELRVGDVTVRASFETSYEGLCHGGQDLDRDAARAFRLFGVVPGPDVSLPVATALLGVPAARAENALERLVDAHLLHSPSPLRYKMHDLLRLFAREAAECDEREDEREAALERLVRCYLATAQRAVSALGLARHLPERPVGDPSARPVRLADRTEATAWLETERENLLATVKQAATRSEHLARLAVWLTQPLQWFLYPRADVQELRHLNELAIRTARDLGDREGEAWGLNNMASVHWLCREYAEMRECLESAIAIWRAIGDRKGEQASLCNLADALAELELFEEAMAVQESQLAAARELGDRLAELAGLGNLGRICRGLGRSDEALANFQESIRCAREIGDQTCESFALHEVSRLHRESKRFQEAQEALERMERLSAAWTDPGAYARWRGHPWSAIFPHIKYAVPS